MSIPQKLKFVNTLKSINYKGNPREHADKFDTFMPTKVILQTTSHADKTDTYADT